LGIAVLASALKEGPSNEAGGDSRGGGSSNVTQSGKAPPSSAKSTSATKQAYKEGWDGGVESGRNRLRELEQSLKNAKNETMRLEFTRTSRRIITTQAEQFAKNMRTYQQPGMENYRDMEAQCRGRYEGFMSVVGHLVD
jgi:hypothetical protein